MCRRGARTGESFRIMAGESRNTDKRPRPLRVGTKIRRTDECLAEVVRSPMLPQEALWTDSEDSARYSRSSAREQLVPPAVEDSGGFRRDFPLSPAGIGPRRKPGTGAPSGATVMLAAFAGEFRCAYRSFMPTSRRKAGGKTPCVFAAVRSTPQNQSFFLRGAARSRDSSSFFIARRRTDARKKPPRDRGSLRDS